MARKCVALYFAADDAERRYKWVPTRSVGTRRSSPIHAIRANTTRSGRRFSRVYHGSSSG